MNQNQSYLEKEDYDSFCHRVDNITTTVKKRTELLTELTFLISKIPDNLDLYIKRAVAYRKRGCTGDTNLSIKDILYVLGKNPTGKTKILAQYNLGIDYLYDEDEELALKGETIFEDLISQGEPIGHFGIAWYYRKKKETEKSLEHVEKCLENFDILGKALQRYALGFKAYTHRYPLKEFEKSEEIYLQLLKLFPNHFYGWYNLGNLYKSDLKEKKKAFDAYKNCLMIEGSNYEIGNYYMDSEKDYEMSIHYFTREIENNPTYAKAYLERGRSYYITKRYDEALEDFDMAIKNNYNGYRAVLSRGKIFLYQRKYKEAEEELIQSMEIRIEFGKNKDYVGHLYCFKHSFRFFISSGKYYFQNKNFGESLYHLENFTKYYEILRYLTSGTDTIVKERDSLLSSFENDKKDAKLLMEEIYAFENIGEILREKEMLKSRKIVYKDLEERIGYIIGNFRKSRFFSIFQQSFSVPSFFIEFELFV